MTHALLLYPEFPDTFWSFKHALKFISKKASSPPLGLLTVAAMLPRHWRKKLVDLNVEPLTDADLDWADCVFISAMAVQQRSAADCIRRCAARGIRVVAGGPLFTGSGGQFGGVDHFVLQEAELTLPRFLDDLAAGHPQRVYVASGFADLSTTPVPLWDLIDLKNYAELSVQFSRGCPFDCEFCNITAMLGRRPRIKSVSQILAELDCGYDLGYRGGIFFVDDNFIGNKKYLKTRLLPALIKWRKEHPGITFHTEVSINIADDGELMAGMTEAGFDTVFIGIETPDAASLTECSKLQNKNRDMLADIRKIQRGGMQVQGGFIVGFDSDDEKIFQRQIDFIQKSGITTAMVGLLQALPGTRLYERLKSEGRLKNEGTGDNVGGTTNIVPRMNPDALHAGYRHMLEHIYSPRNYYRRAKTFLQNYRPPRIQARRAYRLGALFRSILRLGILGRERLQYWKLLVWTMVTCRSRLPLAVALAILGFHFRKTVQEHVLKLDRQQLP